MPSLCCDIWECCISFCIFSHVVFSLSFISRNSNFSILISFLAQLPLSNMLFRFHEHVCCLVDSIFTDIHFYCTVVRQNSDVISVLLYLLRLPWVFSFPSLLSCGLHPKSDMVIILDPQILLELLELQHTLRPYDTCHVSVELTRNQFWSLPRVYIICFSSSEMQNILSTLGPKEELYLVVSLPLSLLLLC